MLSGQWVYGAKFERGKALKTPEPTRASLRDFLNVIFKRKYQILLFFFVIFSAVAIATLLTKPTYQATCQILVKPGREKIFMPATGGYSPVISVNREEQLNSEIEIIKNRSLAQEVVEAIGPTTIYPELDGKEKGILASVFSGFKEQPSPLEKTLLKLQKNLNVQGIKKSNIIQISFNHASPKMAAAVVDMLARRYLDKHATVYKTDSQRNAGVYLIEPTLIPLKPLSPKMFLNLILGFLLGLFGGLGLAFFLNYIDDSLETVEDVEAALDVPVLASVSLDKKEAH
jgi:uncharacterized protein involved in exopolysaccharide biosynthesis